MSINLAVSGIEQAFRNIEKYKSSVTDRLEKDVNIALINVQTDAKRNAPVDTGRLRSSIHLTQAGLEGTVHTNVSYAPFMEFGTGSKVDIPEGQEQYAAQFKGEGGRTVSMSPKPFLFPAWEKERPEFIKRVRKTLGALRAK